jgi:hypothetical protein
VSGVVSPPHRPAVAFSAHRASAPARRPAVACDVRRPRSISATSGRLDGLPRRRCTLLRCVLPEGAPLRMCPNMLEALAAHSQGAHARRCALLVLRDARAGAGHRWERKGQRSPGERPADARHPSPCPRRQASPVREVTCSAEPVNLGPREAREEVHRRRGAFGAHGAVPGDRRWPSGSTWCGTPSAAPGIRHAPSGEPLQRRLASATRAAEKFFSDDWLRHARSRELRSAAAPLGPAPPGSSEGLKQLSPARFQIQLRNCAPGRMQIRHNWLTVMVR